MKKYSDLVLSILQTVLILSTFVVKYFTKKKMGMARYMVYLSSKWEEKYPVEVIKYLLLAVFVIFTVACVYYFIKNKTSFLAKLEVAILIVLTVTYSLIAAFYERHEHRELYVELLIFAVVIGIQMIKIYFYKKEIKEMD